MSTETRSDYKPVIDHRGDARAAESDRGRLRGFTTGLRGGFLATVVMSAFRLPIARSPPPTAWLWAQFVEEGDPDEYVVQGFVLHLLYGTIGGGIFGALTGPYLTGEEVDREIQSTLLGTVYGLFLSFFGVTVLLERVLRMDLESDERFVFHVSHVVYGLALGTWFGSSN